MTLTCSDSPISSAAMDNLIEASIRSDSCARTLVQRFNVASEELPIVLCPGGQLLRNPGESQLARCVGLLGPIDSERFMTSS